MASDPAARVRRRALLALIGLGVVASDVLRIYRDAGKFRAQQRVERRDHARELNLQEEEARARIDQLLDTINEQRAKLASAVWIKEQTTQSPGLSEPTADEDLEQRDTPVDVDEQAGQA